MIHLLAQVFLALKVLNTESIISQGLKFESQLVIAMSVNFFWIESQPISQSWILKSISGVSNNRARCYRGCHMALKFDKVSDNTVSLLSGKGIQCDGQ